MSFAFFQKDIGFTYYLFYSNLYLFALQASTNFFKSSALMSIPLCPNFVNFSFFTLRVFPAFYALGFPMYSNVASGYSSTNKSFKSFSLWVAVIWFKMWTFEKSFFSPYSSAKVRHFIESLILMNARVCYPVPYKVIGCPHATWEQNLFNTVPKSLSTSIRLHKSGCISVSGVLTPQTMP